MIIISKGYKHSCCDPNCPDKIENYQKKRQNHHIFKNIFKLLLAYCAEIYAALRHIAQISQRAYVELWPFLTILPQNLALTFLRLALLILLLISKNKLLGLQNIWNSLCLDFFRIEVKLELLGLKFKMEFLMNFRRNRPQCSLQRRRSRVEV